MHALTPRINIAKPLPSYLQATSLLRTGLRLGLFLWSSIACTPITTSEHATHNTIQIQPRPSLTIMQIQGHEASSAFVNQRVITSGIITLFSKDQQHFWLQDPRGDNNEETSDGIFVNAKQILAQGRSPVVGDLIQLTALVQERQFSPALPLTMLTEVTELDILHSQQALPKPVIIENVPEIGRAHV